MQGKITPPPCCRILFVPGTRVGDRYDWTTGVRDNGNDWRKFRETEGLLDYEGRAGIISIVRWNLRPVIFGVERGVLSLGRLSRKGHQKNVYVCCVYSFFFHPNLKVIA